MKTPSWLRQFFFVAMSLDNWSCLVTRGELLPPLWFISWLPNIFRAGWRCNQARVPVCEELGCESSILCTVPLSMVWVVCWCSAIASFIWWWLEWVPLTL